MDPNSLQKMVPRARKSRDRSEVVRDILVCVATDMNKTRMMRHANVSYKAFGTYWKLLEDAGFIEQQAAEGKADRQFCLTDRGRRFVEHYDALAALLLEGPTKESPVMRYIL